MANFTVNKNYEAEIIKLLSTFPIKSIGTVFKRGTRNKHLYTYLQNKYPFLEGKGTTEYLYWLVHNLTEYPKCKRCSLLLSR